MMMPGRKYSSDSYRYGFNGKENDNEVKGEGNQQDYGFRINDPRLGRFLSVDPLTDEYPELTPFQFAGNTPIQATDLDGLEPAYHYEDDKGRLILMPAGDNLKRVVPVEHLKYFPQTGKDDGSTVRTISNTLDIIPVAGTIKGGIEGIAGYSMEGDKLSPGERFFGIVPYAKQAKKAFKIVKAADKVDEATKQAKTIVKSKRVTSSSDNSIVKNPTDRRVYVRKNTKEQVKQNQPKNDKGELLDPNTGEVLDPKKMDLGHKPGQEWHRRKEMHKAKGSTRKEVIEEENNPDLYQYENRSNNRSREYEQKN
jgi:RHS repeat-associated protein